MVAADKIPAVIRVNTVARITFFILNSPESLAWTATLTKTAINAGMDRNFPDRTWGSATSSARSFERSWAWWRQREFQP
jgi:hypothetical protein